MLHSELVGKPVIDFLSVVIELFQPLLRLKYYERKSVWVFWIILVTVVRKREVLIIHVVSKYQQYVILFYHNAWKWQMEGQILDSQDRACISIAPLHVFWHSTDYRQYKNYRSHAWAAIFTTILKLKDCSDSVMQSHAWSCELVIRMDPLMIIKLNVGCYFLRSTYWIQ